MQQEKYDIFISYRRVGGIDKAQLLKLILANKGYSVFMDVHELTYGAFGNHIKEAIESAPVFLVLLTPNALDRCVDEDDWVRKEIEYAVEKRKCIIPINPNGSFAGLPDGMKLPETINMVLDIHNYATVDFEQSIYSSMDDLVVKWIAPAIKAEEVRLERERQAAHEAYLLGLPDVEFTPFKTKGKFGYKIKSTGESAISCEYDKVTSFSEGIAAIKKDGKWGYINKRGKVVIEIKYDKANSVVNGVAEVKLHDQTLYFDTKGAELSQDYILSNDIFPSWKTKLIRNKKPITIGSVVIALLVCCYSFIPFMNSSHLVNEGELDLIVKNRYNLSQTYNRYALYTLYGSKLTRFKYSYLENTFTEGFARIEVSGKLGFIDKTGREITPLKYDVANAFSEGLAKVRIGSYKDGKYGFIDKTGGEITPLKYDKADDFRDGLAKVGLDGKWGFIDKTGEEITPLKYDKADDFSDGLAKVKLDGKYGFIDKTGEEIIHPKYDYADDFRNGLAQVRVGPIGKGGKYGYIDQKGKEVIPLKYDFARVFYYNLVEVNIGGKWSLMDFLGNVVTSVEYDFIWDLHEGLAMVELDGKYGFIDKTGKEVIRPKYDYANSFRNGLAQVRVGPIGKGGKYGYIDKIGNEVIPLKYDFISTLHEGLARVELDGKYGFIDKKVKEIIHPKYDFAYHFRDGLAVVKLDGKYGFIDKKGKEVIPLKYDYADDFRDGLAKVELDGKYGFIDKTGEEVIPLKYDFAGEFSDGLAAVKLKEKWGYINEKGKKVISFKYEEANSFTGMGKAKVKLNGEEFYIDKNGNRVEE